MGGAASKIQNQPQVRHSLNEAQIPKLSRWQVVKDNIAEALAWVGVSHGGVYPVVLPGLKEPVSRKALPENKSVSASFVALYILPGAMISGDYCDSPTVESYEMRRVGSVASKISDVSREMTIWDLPPM